MQWKLELGDKYIGAAFRKPIYRLEKPHKLMQLMRLKRQCFSRYLKKSQKLYKDDPVAREQ